MTREMNLFSYQRGGYRVGGRFCLGRGTWMFIGRVGNTSIKCQLNVQGKRKLKKRVKKLEHIEVHILMFN